MQYKQMKLIRDNGNNSTSERILYGDVRKAELGREVTVEEDNGEVTTGWIVKEVYGEAVSKEFVDRARHAHTKQRKASDI